MKSYHQVLVPALDALIGNPEILNPDTQTKKKADILAIPAHFIMRATELRGEQTNRGEACGELLKQFNMILGDIHHEGKHICDNGMEIVFIEDRNATKTVNPSNRRGYEPSSSKMETIKAAKLYQSKLKNGQTLAILTGDNAMSSLAYSEGFDVAHINPTVYTGRRKVVMPEEVYYAWQSKSEMTAEEFKANFPDEKPLHINEFVEFMLAPGVPFERNNYYNHIARFEPNNGQPVLRAIHHLREYKGRIYPRNARQAMLLEALMISADEVPIVICPGLFGTGKTFCTVASAYFQTVEMGEHARYERIFVVPSEGSPGGRELGALPGSKDEKIAPMIAPIKDNLYNYLRAKGDKSKGGKPKNRLDVMRDVENALAKFFELEALQYISGRSITDSMIIYDEAQALERGQIKQLLTRIGSGSKMVCMGDPGQVYNRHMNANSNGLSWASSKLEGNPYAIVVTLNPDEVERSKAAKAIAACIG